MIQNCPICGKAFEILWPHLWAYKKSSQFLCSWSCLRTNEKKGVSEMDQRQKIPEEVKKEAIHAAVSGGNPLDVLRPHSDNPKALWAYMKAQMKKSDPETYAKLPDLRFRKKKEEPAEEKAPEAVTVTKVEKVPEISKPLVYSGMTVREIEGNFGRYRRTDVNGKTYVDFEWNEDMDIVSYTTEQWRAFRKEQVQAFAVLGVSL